MMLSAVRFAYLPTCTLSQWDVGGKRLYGLAEPWKASKLGPGGQRRDIEGVESCIPDGVYQMRPHVSRRHPYDDYVWYLENPSLGVYAPGKRPAGQKWGRDAVLVHIGNDLDDTLGCELVGQQHSMAGGKFVLANSRPAIETMRTILGRDSHQLVIRSTYGTKEGLI